MKDRTADIFDKNVDYALTLLRERLGASDTLNALIKQGNEIEKLKLEVGDLRQRLQALESKNHKYK